MVEELVKVVEYCVERGRLGGFGYEVVRILMDWQCLLRENHAFGQVYRRARPRRLFNISLRPFFRLLSRSYTSPVVPEASASSTYSLRTPTLRRTIRRGQ